MDAATLPAPPGGRPRLRATHRGRRVLLAAALVAVTGLAVGAVRVIGWPEAWLPDALAGPPCTLTTPDGDRSLELDAARRLTTVALAGDTAADGAAAGGAAARGADDDEGATVRVLRGSDAALSCRLSAAERDGRRTLADQPEGRAGLTPRADAVRRAMQDAAGPLRLGGFAPGGVTSGHMAGSAHYDGRAIDVFFRPVTTANSRHGWLLAQWLVAHAGDLDVATVIFDDRIWTASAAAAGWRPYVPPQGPTRNPVLRHRDHVHVDVVRGS